MPKRYQIGGEFVSVTSTHLGGTSVAFAGTAIALTLPAGVNSAYIRPEGAACYYTIGGGTASAAAHGYVPQDIGEYILPVDNLSAGLSLFAASGTVHVQFFADY